MTTLDGTTLWGSWFKPTGYWGIWCLEWWWFIIRGVLWSFISPKNHNYYRNHLYLSRFLNLIIWARGRYWAKTNSKPVWIGFSRAQRIFLCLGFSRGAWKPYVWRLSYLYYLVFLVARLVVMVILIESRPHQVIHECQRVFQFVEIFEWLRMRAVRRRSALVIIPFLIYWMIDLTLREKAE